MAQAIPPLIPFLHGCWHFRSDNLCLNASKMIAEVPNQIVSALSFIGFILYMIPFPWHWKSVCSRSLSGACLLANQEMTALASNRGTCLYIIWSALGCLNQFINSVVWNKNTVNKAPVWCDICEVLCIYLYATA